MDGSIWYGVGGRSVAARQCRPLKHSPHWWGRRHGVYPLSRSASSYSSCPTPGEANSQFLAMNGLMATPTRTRWPPRRGNRSNLPGNGRGDQEPKPAGCHTRSSLAMADFGTHATFLSTDLPTTLSTLLRSHVTAPCGFGLVNKSRLSK